MSHKVEILVDSNVLFSALYKIASIPGLIVYLGILGRIKLLSPESIRDEIAQILKYKLSYSDEEIEFTLSAMSIEWIPQNIYVGEMDKFSHLVEDYQDRALLICAMQLNMPIVSGDKDFQQSEVKKLARIYTPRELVEFLINTKIISNKEINEILGELTRLEKLPY